MEYDRQGQLEELGIGVVDDPAILEITSKRAAELANDDSDDDFGGFVEALRDQTPNSQTQATAVGVEEHGVPGGVMNDAIKNALTFSAGVVVGAVAHLLVTNLNGPGAGAEKSDATTRK